MAEPKADHPQGFEASPKPRYTSVGFSPTYHVPSAPITGIEHPCVIKNKDRGIQSLGGLSQLQKVSTPSHQQQTDSISAPYHLKADIPQLVNHTADVVKLNLKPGNRESAPIKSIKVQTSDIVIRVTVPKRTGHKRKRGSDGPFWTPNCSPARLTDGSHPTSGVGSQVKRFLRSLKDNEGQYQVEVVGQVIDTYRFRGLAFLLLITYITCAEIGRFTRLCFLHSW